MQPPQVVLPEPPQPTFDPPPHIASPEVPSFYVPPTSQPYAPAYPAGAPAPVPVKRRSWKKIVLAVFLVFVVLCGIAGIFIGTQIYQASQNMSFPEGGGFRYKTEDGEI